MNQTDSLEAYLAVARQEIDQLRQELRASEKQMARLLQMFEEQQRQVTYLQGALVRVERIFRGRFWRAVRTLLRALARRVGVRQTQTFLDIDCGKGPSSGYQLWIQEFERPELQLIECKASLFAVRPKISIV